MSHILELGASIQGCLSTLQAIQVSPLWTVCTGIILPCGSLLCCFLSGIVFSEAWAQRSRNWKSSWSVAHPCRIGCVFAIQTELFSQVSALELRSQMVQTARVLLIGVLWDTVGLRYVDNAILSHCLPWYKMHLQSPSYGPNGWGEDGHTLSSKTE